MLGVAIPATLLLARNDELAVALDELRAYPTGFTCSLVILHNPMAPRDPADPHGHMRTMHPMMGGGPRLGFEFADGTAARFERPSPPMPPPGAGSVQPSAAILTTNVGAARQSNVFGIPTSDDGIPLQPVLMPRGGGGGGDRYTMTYWCYPLPASGPMTIHADWPDQGFDEIAVPFDADLILDAASNAVTLWEPDE